MVSSPHQKDLTRPHRELLAQHVRDTLKVVADNMKKQGIPEDKETAASVLLHTAVEFLVSESDRAFAISHLEDLRDQVAGDLVEAKIY